MLNRFLDDGTAGVPIRELLCTGGTIGLDHGGVIVEERITDMDLIRKFENASAWERFFLQFTEIRISMQLSGFRLTPFAQLLLQYADRWRIVIVTARDAILRPQTARLLHRLQVPYDTLYMVGSGEGKIELLQREDVDCFVDNAPVNVKLAVDAGIRSYLYLSPQEALARYAMHKTDFHLQKGCISYE